MFDVDGRACALPVAEVEETMRPLPIEAVPDAPAYLRGISIIRGGLTPVVDLGVLLGGAPLADPARAITLKVGAGRRVAVLVSLVRGVSRVEEAQLGALPPLLAGADAGVISALGIRDGELLRVLRLGHLIPDPVWAGMGEGPR